MRVGILGTGVVGRSIGGKLAALGHEVTIGTRDVDALMARTETDARGNESFAEWKGKNPEVKLGTFADAADQGELVVNATDGAGSLEALHSAGEENLDGKVLIDISNPLDYSRGMPPSLIVSNTFPGAKVVKALNTVTAFVMVDPSLVAGSDHTIFMSGNDSQAKAQVGEVLRSFGWQHIVDLGDITTARGVEMYLPLWIRLWRTFGTPMFNIKVVQAQD
jgi:hypothetical protein